MFEREAREFQACLYISHLYYKEITRTPTLECTLECYEKLNSRFALEHTGTETETSNSLSLNSTIMSRTYTSGLGTPVYMAPELCGGVSGTDKYSSRIDVYSFGIICWEASAGVTPWSHVTFKFSYELLDRVQKGDRPPISDIMKANVPAGYFTLVRSCWHQEPKNRPPFHIVSECLIDMVSKISSSPSSSSSSSTDGIELTSTKKQEDSSSPPLYNKSNKKSTYEMI